MVLAALCKKTFSDVIIIFIVCNTRHFSSHFVTKVMNRPQNVFKRINLGHNSHCILTITFGFLQLTKNILWKKSEIKKEQRKKEVTNCRIWIVLDNVVLISSSNCAHKLCEWSGLMGYCFFISVQTTQNLIVVDKQ